MINRPDVSRSIHFKPAWRILCGLALLLALLLSVCTGAGAAGRTSARFTDVSPNALFGETDTNDSDPGGHNWTTASRGLLWGGTRNSGLAVDASNPSACCTLRKTMTWRLTPPLLGVCMLPRMEP